MAPLCLGASTKGITSAAAAERGRLFVAGGDDSFYALDAATLEVEWKTKLGDNSPSGGYYGWCSPAVVGGRVFQGVASNCDDPFVGGRVVALDAGGGSALSAADLSGTSDPGRFGAGVWSSPAVDLDTTAGRRCYALNAASGRLLWKATSEATLYGGVAISDGRVYFGDTAGNFYAYAVPGP